MGRTGTQLENNTKTAATTTAVHTAHLSETVYLRHNCRHVLTLQKYIVLATEFVIKAVLLRYYTVPIAMYVNEIRTLVHWVVVVCVCHT